jgi:outer membrane lipoprotein SlyB
MLEATTDASSKIYETLRGNYDVTDTSFLQSEYNFNYLTFPGNVGSEDVGHYMVININVPVNRNSERRGYVQHGKFLPGEYSKVDILRFGKNINVGETVEGVSIKDGAATRELFSIPRYTRRIAESIALFMPSTLVYSSQNAYEDISLTALGGTVIGGTISTAIGSFAGAVIGSLGGPAGSIVGGAIGGSIARNTASLAPTISRVAGYPINPRVEILFSTTPQRQFVFEVLMAPRNVEESQSMQNIIQTLRLHAAPEIDPITSGLTFIPPAEFDITFYNKGNENRNLPRINTCVLERIDVDFSPAGVFATFHNGHPVICRLSLGFREIEIIHKLRVAQGF